MFATPRAVCRCVFNWQSWQNKSSWRERERERKRVKESGDIVTHPKAFSSLSSAARVLAAFHIATSKMAFASKMIACGLMMLALSSVQSFVPAVFGQHEAPSRGVSSSVAAPIEQATSNMESSPSMMPLALGLSVGLALALPQSALAASSGNEDVGTLIDRLFTKEALGAFGIAGLSWNVFYLLFGLSGAGVILFAVVLSIALPPAKTMADVKKK